MVAPLLWTDLPGHPTREGPVPTNDKQANLSSSACSSSFTILLQETRSPKVWQTFELQFFRFPYHLILLSHVRITRPPGHLGHPAPGNGGQKRQVPDNRWKVISGKTLNICLNFLYYWEEEGGKVPVNRWGVIICVKPTHSPAPPLLNISTAPSSERCNTFGKAHQWTLFTRVIISLPLPGSLLFSAWRM